MKYSFALISLVAVASAEFTSIYNITATPEQVISNAGVPTPGPAGAKGHFNYAINSKTDTICYDITLVNFVGTYQSPAKTATHIHEGVKGKAGPPRIALPNPVGDDKLRHISGCLTGPFTTGLKGADNVTDTGAGFKLSQIEANPAGFFTDSHSALFPAGVVRGQLDQKFEIIKPKPEGYPQGPEYPASTKKEDGYPTKKPEPTYYPEHPEYPTTKKDDGYEITTATYTKTYEVTVSKCKEEVTDCPYKTKPVVTKTEEVYTTVCPKSELSKVYPPKTEKTEYPQTDKHDSYETKTKYETKSYQTTETKYETITISKPGQTYPVYETKTIKTEYPVHTTETKYETITITKPVETYPVETKPVETYPPVYQTTKKEEAQPSKPVYTIETYPVVKPTTTAPYQVTGTGSIPPYATFTGAAGANKVGGLMIAAGLAAALL